jgi:hypothetical protein
MSEYSPEPWSHTVTFGHSQPPLGEHLHDANGEAILQIDLGAADGEAAVKVEDARRIVACVNFCQHLPTALIEEFIAAQISPVTIIRWLTRNPTYPEHRFLDKALLMTKGVL